jgi:5-formyltetrahydrofolate cyclo-ligase
MAGGVGESAQEMKADKEQLREKMREEARRHSPEQRAATSRQICERILALKPWANARSVLLFVPTASEPDISPLIKDGKQVSLPAFNEKLGCYEARLVQSENDLVPGRFGIPEPAASCPLTDLSTLDLVLAPGIAFALDGTRLGRGKGYYDRLLEQVQAIKIGVCFNWQVLPRIPRDSHDVKMDHIVTPTLFS